MQFDPHTGDLRLDAGAFLALADRAAGHVTTATDDVRRLSEAGVLVDGAPHSAVGPALEAVAHPHAQITLTVASASGVHVNQGWLSGVTGLLVDLGDGTYELRAVPVADVPEAAVRLAGLGSRPALPGGDAGVSEQTLDDLASPAPDARRRGAAALVAAAPASWEPWGACVAAGQWSFTVLDAFWATRFASLANRRVAVLDTPAGLVLVEPGGSGLRLVPTTADELRRFVADVLPSEVEVRGT